MQISHNDDQSPQSINLLRLQITHNKMYIHVYCWGGMGWRERHWLHYKFENNFNVVLVKPLLTYIHVHVYMRYVWFYCINGTHKILISHCREFLTF